MQKFIKPDVLSKSVVKLSNIEFVTSTQTARTRLALTFVLVKRVLRVTVKHVKVKLKRKMAPYRKDHILLIGAKTFIVRGTILIPLISNGHLVTLIKNDFLTFYVGVSIRLLGFRL